MSPQYQQAMLTAHIVTDRLTPKILAKKLLTAREGKRLLDVNWRLYLHAFADGDVEEARETAEFLCLVETYLRLGGYTVELTEKGTYRVYRQRRNKHAKK